MLAETENQILLNTLSRTNIFLLPLGNHKYFTMVADVESSDDNEAIDGGVWLIEDALPLICRYAQ